jgi:hypothetical protein
MNAPKLSWEAIHAEAVELVGGLSNLGPGDIRTPLEFYLEDVNAVPLPPVEAHAMFQRLRSWMVTHLRSTATLRRTPSIRELRLPRQLVIVSLPRSGSTFFHNLLNVDVRARSFKLWELLHPYPLDVPVAEGAVDPRVDAVDQMTKRVPPELLKIHEIRTHSPEECHRVFAPTFACWLLPYFVDSPRYVEWLIEHPLDWQYDYYVDRLKLILAERPSPPGGHLLLKDPNNHPSHLEELHRVMPNACVVVLHRDLSECVGSLCSFTRVLRGGTSNREQLRAIGAYAERWTEYAVTRLAESRERLPASMILDVDYAELVADPMRVVGRVYDRFGFELSAVTEASMGDWLSSHRTQAGSKHAYRLEDYGLSHASVHAIAR